MEVKIGPYPVTNGETVTRQIDVKIDDYDMWNLDWTLSLIIHPSLVKFKENLNGHPSQLTMDEWKVILDEMIWSFGQIASWLPEEPDYTLPIEEYNAYHAKIQKGVDLFGKYFRNLWD